MPPPHSAAWKAASPLLRAGDVPADWPGSGWFRVDLEVAPELAGRPLALRFHRHQGASRVYVDGARLFTGIFLSFALLHLLLFVFRPESSENLYFAAFCSCLAILAFLIVHRSLVSDPRMLFWAEPTMNACGVAFAIFGVLFVHRVFGRGVPRAVRWMAPVAGVVLVWGVLRPADSMSTIFVVMLAALAEMARSVVAAVVRREPGARIIGAGIVAVACGFGAGLLPGLRAGRRDLCSGGGKPGAVDRRPAGGGWRRVGRGRRSGRRRHLRRAQSRLKPGEPDRDRGCRRTRRGGAGAAACSVGNAAPSAA